MEQAQKCNEALASLIACTKRRIRPKTLVEISEDLDVALQCFGSIETVASKIGLSVSMLRRFQTVKRLDPLLQKLVASRAIDSIDSVAELASLSPSLQIDLAENLYSENDNFDTEDIRSCVRLLSRDPNAVIEDVLRKVREAKTTHLYVYEFVRKDSMGNQNDIEKRVKNELGDDSLFSLELGPATGRLKLTNVGKKMVAQQSKQHQVKVRIYVQKLCEGSI